MFAQYLGLRFNPFEIKCDSSGAFFHEHFQAVYDSLRRDIHEKTGIILLVGYPGVGKSTLIHRIIKDIGKNKPIQYIDARLIERSLRVEPGQPFKRFPPELIKSSAKKLSENNPSGLSVRDTNRNITVIDHASILDEQYLDKLISLGFNLDQENAAGLLILVGYPILETRLNKPEFKHLGGRIIRCLHLEKLPEGEVLDYIDSRLKKAGKRYNDFFSQDVLKPLYKLSNGIPGNINNLCAASMVFITIEGDKTISREVLEEVSEHCLFPCEMDISATNTATAEAEQTKNPINIANPDDNTEQALPVIETPLLNDQNWEQNLSPVLINEENIDIEDKAEPQQVVTRKIEPFLNHSIFSPAQHPLFLVMIGCILGITLSFLFMRYQPSIIVEQVAQAGQNGKVKKDRSEIAQTTEKQPNPNNTDDPDDLKKIQLAENQASPQELELDFQNLEPTGAGVATTAIVDFALKQNFQTETDTQENHHFVSKIENITAEIEFPPEEVSMLLEQAEEHKKNNRYSIPVGNNAVETYRQVLELDPSNEQGRLGLLKIKQIYFNQAMRAEAIRDWKNAEINLERALNVEPGDQQISAQLAELRNLLSLQQELQQDSLPK